MINIVTNNDIITVTAQEFATLVKQYDTNGYHVEQINVKSIQECAKNDYPTFLLCYWK